MSRAEATDAIRQASSWFARLQADHVDAQEHQAWERWLEAHPSHQKAWQLVEEVRAQLGHVPSPRSAGQALNAAGRGRRRALGQLVAVLGMGTAGAILYRNVAWQGWLADYRTAIGERRQLTLPDGSSLSINTASALDVAYSSAQRLLKLHAGEILVTTARDTFATPRPFLVQTPHGSALALGTRFTVRVDAHSSQVAVLEKAVRVQATSGTATTTVPAGWNVRIGDGRLDALRANDASIGSWQYGSIVAVDMPLRQLVAELARYRPGHLGCSEDVAALKVSGAFPIDDTDRALAALTRSFPLRITRHSRYWVAVESR